MPLLSHGGITPHSSRLPCTIVLTLRHHAWARFHRLPCFTAFGESGTDHRIGHAHAHRRPIEERTPPAHQQHPPPLFATGVHRLVSTQSRAQMARQAFHIAFAAGQRGRTGEAHAVCRPTPAFADQHVARIVDRSKQFLHHAREQRLIALRGVRQHALQRAAAIAALLHNHGRARTIDETQFTQRAQQRVGERRDGTGRRGYRNRTHDSPDSQRYDGDQQRAHDSARHHIAR